MLGRNGIPGRSKTLQVARQRTNEKTGRIANAENKPTQIARGSWPSGGDVQETDGHRKTRSDWAALAIGGTAGYTIVNPIGPMV